MGARLDLWFRDARSLDEALRGELLHGRAFVPGATNLEVFMPCELALHHPSGGAPLVVGATVVASKDAQREEGGVRLVLDDGAIERVRAFGQQDADSDSDADGDGDADSESDADSERQSNSRALSPVVRLSKLTILEQQKLARTSMSMTERTALERLLDRVGWAELLQNPYITVPEVARIARKGSVPRPLIEQIANNGLWARTPIVRRALLGNPKLTLELIQKVLRMTPAHELRLVLKHTAYPPAVREIARQMLGRPGSS